MDNLGVPPFQETPIFYKIVNGSYKHFETKPHFFGGGNAVGSDLSHMLENELGLHVRLPKDWMLMFSVVERDGMWWRGAKSWRGVFWDPAKAGRAVTVRFRSPSCNATLPWRWAAGSVGMSWKKKRKIYRVYVQKKVAT